MPEYRKIDDRGRITLPAKYMKALDLNPGDVVEVYKKDAHMVIYRATHYPYNRPRRAGHG